jgi:UDP-galactopyranose mutase
VPAPDTALMYAKYKALADKREDVSFVGRLARYQYLNMDQVVGMALKEFEKLKRVL